MESESWYFCTSQLQPSKFIIILIKWIGKISISWGVSENFV